MIYNCIHVIYEYQAYVPISSSRKTTLKHNLQISQNIHPTLLIQNLSNKKSTFAIVLNNFLVFVVLKNLKLVHNLSKRLFSMVNIFQNIELIIATKIVFKFIQLHFIVRGVSSIRDFRRDPPE